MADLTDKELIALMADHAPQTGEVLPPGVEHVTQIWEAMRRAGGESHEGFPAAHDAVTSANLQRMHEIAKEIA